MHPAPQWDGDTWDCIAQYARSAGITATIEQARSAKEAAAADKPAHTADIYMMDAAAHETWVDVMITAAHPARPIDQSLREAKTHKRREVAFVLEQYGRPVCDRSCWRFDLQTGCFAWENSGAAGSGGEMKSLHSHLDATGLPAGILGVPQLSLGAKRPALPYLPRSEKQA